MITTTERVDDWVEGWCRARGVQRVREDGVWLVDVGAESRTRERILVDPSPSALQAGAERVAGPQEWLTVIGLGDESLMAALLGPGRTAEGALLAGAVLEAADGVASVRLLVDGVVAAQGTAAVHGTVAVLDRIETDARFRRRGLGRRVVDALIALARSEGHGAVSSSPAHPAAPSTSPSAGRWSRRCASGAGPHSEIRDRAARPPGDDPPPYGAPGAHVRLSTEFRAADPGGGERRSSREAAARRSVLSR
ncbi:hypothetical protein C5C86_08485 [Rathayibacter sp. AY1E4]|uniref:GNAT family N-acetyltransferase n=1 Tax=unclassified Rathayibacter TaxID=2609250 RepID=UPI000CE8907C|nr:MULTISPECIES: GNAT family N-acetyltransferase [unclassified Rathayibacter]PPG58407.1 hypothetical protein C5C57_09745 [Rathayibacter sp. AY1C5]PPH41198.1 hypothetical protein C5C86_08485 [Rathayibacter sp. AY1E4]